MPAAELRDTAAHHIVRISNELGLEQQEIAGHQEQIQKWVSHPLASWSHAGDVAAPESCAEILCHITCGYPIDPRFPLDVCAVTNSLFDPLVPLVVLLRCPSSCCWLLTLLLLLFLLLCLHSSSTQEYCCGMWLLMLGRYSIPSAAVDRLVLLLLLGAVAAAAALPSTHHLLQQLLLVLLYSFSLCCPCSCSCSCCCCCWCS